MKLLRQLRALFRKETLDREMSEEMGHHLDLQTEANQADGMNATVARHAAQREFGGVEQIKETARDQRGFRWLEHLIQDLRYAVRQLRKNPGFTAVALLTLALGIGACTVVFSVVYIAVLHPFAYPHPEQLVAIHEVLPPKFPRGAVSPPAFLEFQKQATVFSGLAACLNYSQNVTGGDEPFRAYTSHVTANYLSVFGVQPVLGRDFRADEDKPGAPGVVILRYNIWQSYFGGRPEAIGQAITINETQAAMVIGVLPPEFHPEINAPAMYTLGAIPPRAAANYAARFLTVTGRLKPERTATQAQTELEVIARRLASQYPDTNKGWAVFVNPLTEETVEFARPLLYTLLGSVAFLLLIACVNIANLLLARATSRQKEIVLRTALGASSGRIVRQLLGESLLLAVLGGLLGVLLAKASMQLILAFAPVDLPRRSEISVNGVSLAFSCGLVLLTGLGFGLVPALQATRVDLNQVLKDSGRGSGESRGGLRLRRLLVIAEVALAVVLLVGAGLLAKSFLGMVNLPRGYEPKGLYVTPLGLTQQAYSTAAAQITYFERLQEQLVQVHGVTSAGILSPWGRGGRNFEIAGQPPQLPANQPQADTASVTKEAMTAIGMRLLRGRAFGVQDTPTSPPVILINEEMARLHFSGKDPIGQRINVITYQNSQIQPAVWREIVGVLANTRSLYEPFDPFHAQIYLPFAQYPAAGGNLYVRLAPGTPIDLRALGAAVHAVNKDVPFTMMWQMTTAPDAGVPGMRRLSMFLSTGFSFVALLLAAIGIYGVMAYHVAQRTGEIGIRMALGAQRGDVLRMIMTSGGWLVGLGLAVGLAGALAMVRLLATQLYNLSPYDPFVFCVIPLVIVGVAFLACWLPARRASRVDPLVALRHE